MILAGRPAKILLIDTNVYFSKRLSDALKREGFEVNCSTQPSFALTTLEYDAPTAIVCSTNMREIGALDIARLIRADAKNSALPIIALGDGSQRALMEAFQAGCDDYVDRTRPPAVLATHIRNVIISKAEGFQPTQMLTQSDTSLSGSLSHHDLPGVMQMLGHAHQTGALHINSGDTDALLFFDAGTITHAECASLFGDEAVIQILKSCVKNNSGVYKFVYGSASPQRTVLRCATDLMLDAMREIDESTRDTRAPDAADSSSLEALRGPASSPTTESAAEDRVAALVDRLNASSPEPFRDSAGARKTSEPALSEFEHQRDFNLQNAEDSDHAAITTLIDDLALSAAAPPFESAHAPDGFASEETSKLALEAQPEIQSEPGNIRPAGNETDPAHLYHNSESVLSPVPGNFDKHPAAEASEAQEFQRHEAAAKTATENEHAGLSQPSDESSETEAMRDPFANYSIVPYPGNESEDMT